MTKIKCIFIYMKLLELFSGTHSIGKIAKKYNIDVVSLDRDLDSKCPLGTDYESPKHFKEDIMTFDYKQFNPDEFDIITASPVCLWWSNLRNTWIGRKLKAHGDTIITKEILEEDINKFGKPMVDKVYEIINYFNPKYFWIENPSTGKMKHYINEKYLTPFFDVDYCKYSNFGYQKRTRFWYRGLENFKPKLCKKDCENIIEIETKQQRHKSNMACDNLIQDENGKMIRCNTKELRDKYLRGGKKYKKIKTIINKNNRLERYRIPYNLIDEFFKIITTESEQHDN